MKRHCHLSYGFSLLELLVVMLLIAVAAGGVSLVVRGESTAKRINLQGDAVFAQMQYALDAALIGNNAIGLVVVQSQDAPEMPRAYEWARAGKRDQDSGAVTWEATHAPLGKHTLADNMVWTIHIEDTSLEEGLDTLLNDDQAQPQPLIVFYPSGEVSPFFMVFSLSQQALAKAPEAVNERYTIVLNRRGQLARYPVGQQDAQ